MKALILLADGFEDVQFFGPWYRLQEEGLLVTVATPGGQTVTGLHGYRVEADSSLHEVNPTEYDLLLIPGGSSPEKLRQREEAVDIARTLMEEDRIVATIGHGPQLLISAQALDQHTLTCSPGIRDDVRAADARYKDEGVIVDGTLISCRGSADLPQFFHQLVNQLTSKTR